jgi:hypothetical protein
MSAVSDRYRECFLFVDANDRPAVVARLSERYGAEAVRQRLILVGVELDIVGGDKPTSGGQDDFTEWGTKVEVYATTMPDAEVVTFVTDLMVSLRSLGHRVVAACDFEDELPQTDFR